MTRQKKSRKPGVLGTKSQPKNLREHARNEPGKKPHKAKGKPAGNRHSLVDGATSHSEARRAKDDPRHGSKRKIPLTVSAAPSKGDVDRPKDDVAMTPEQEFAALENNQRLQQLLAQLDQGQRISDSDQQWVDAQLDRYQALAQQLGIDLEEGAEDEERDDEERDDEDLEPWQRFENPKDWVE